MLRNAIIAGFAACLFAGGALADITVEITKGGVARTPVAVVPFGWTGQGADVPLDIAEVIAADLQRSGRFAPIPEENMLQKPTTGAELDFDDWSFVKAEAVVVGRSPDCGLLLQDDSVSRTHAEFRRVQRIVAAPVQPDAPVAYSNTQGFVEQATPDLGGVFPVDVSPASHLGLV